MKFNAALLMAVTFSLVSFRGEAQAINIKGNNLQIENLIKEIQKQSGYNFLFDDQLLAGTKAKQIDIKNASVTQALQAIFEHTNISYVVTDKNIVLKKKAKATNSTTTTKQQQEKIRKGTIQNDQGTVLPGATIRNKRTGAIVVSDSQGEFAIPAESDDILEGTFLGYQRSDLKIKTDDTTVRIVLSKAVTELSDIVIVGYGAQQKKLVAGAINTIKGEELAQSPAVNLSNTLMGRAPGLTSTMTSGAPDRDRATLKIRGMGEALIVIDGVAREGQGIIGMEIDKLDPNSIESVTILKDAAAAVYGTRGANGVVLITTKKGTRDKLEIGYSGQLGFQESTRLPRFLDSYRYALLNNEMYDNDIAERGTSPKTKYTDAELQKFLDGSDPNRYPNTNWYKEVLNTTAMLQKHNVNINGGSKNARYFVSGSYTDQDGLMKTSGLKRYGLVSNTNYDITKNTNLAVGINYITETASNPSAYAETIFSRLASLGSISPAQFTNGFYAYSGFSGNPKTDVMPESGYNRTTRNVFTGSFRLTQQIPFVKGLSAGAAVTVDRNSSFQKGFTIPVQQYTIAQNTDDYTLQNGTEKPYLDQTYNQNNNVNVQVRMNYKRKFGAHNVDAMALYEQNEFKSEMMNASRSNYPVSSLDQLFLGDASTQKNLGSSTENARRSVVGRLVYSYNQRYIVEGSFRHDSSPYYPKGKRDAFFPAVSAAWIVSDERFIKDNFSFVDNLKLRSSYGRLGNDGGNLYTYFYNYAVVPAGYVFGTSNTITPLTRISNLTVPNTNITWEKVDAFDIGLDAILWKGKLGFEVDYYNKNKFDILRSRSYDVPLSFGITPALQNFARERYYGYEAAVSHRSKIKDVQINARLNMTYTKSTVVDYGENDAVLPGNRQEGSTVGMVRILKANGIFKDEADVANWPKYLSSPNGTPITPKPGDIRYEDMNGDGVVELYSGSPDRAFEAQYINPPTVYGLNLGASWKGLSVDAFFQASTDIFINYTAANDIANFYELHMDRWTPENLNASYPRLLSNYENNRLPSTFFVKNGNYLKLRTAQIAYTVPSAWLTRTGLRSVGLTLQGQNLFTISKNRRYDPESTGATANLYPPQRIFSFGVRVGI
ncbi:TonB-dependent receptor [Sphingobacterium psychroaquaticum]|uniref:TonB-linked outer membrane protein, SusC/RagA family n=1 Tax=Sphingobacterium psychroaquaticum TaxID=561061 RepID=A0A1X7JQ22_9SPHI|nr:TonB-dependent receptor [Sphingobacterium psychroaquaticum]SMG30063.1 TonB-linked outer membrane protein, SusC/RagA family [Sphingobacterium psychroaquaticum]